MKRSISILTFVVFTVSAILYGCENDAQKVKDAENNVAKANSDLVEANKEYLSDVQEYKKEKLQKIDENTKNIAEFRARVEKEKRKDKTEYLIKLNKLENKNTDFKKEIDDFNSESKVNWKAFKDRFNRDMEKMKYELNDLSTDKK